MPESTSSGRRLEAMRGHLDNRRRLAATAVEVVLAVGISSAIVAALKGVAPVAGLDGIYLLAVLAIAVRRGQMAAVAAALASALVFNFFFLEPVHQLTIDASKDVVALAVLLIAALAVGRLAALARDRAGEAEERAELASAREREAVVVAQATAALLGEGGLDHKLDDIAAAVAAAGEGIHRIGFSAAPAPRQGEAAIAIPASERSAWLYTSRPAGWQRRDLERLAASLGGLVDVAVQRDRAAALLAGADEARRADAAKTAVLHAISHDLRTPLTAIQTAAAGLGGSNLSREDTGELLRVIDEEAARLASLVDDLLDLSRIQADAVGPQPDWCDLAEIAMSAVAQVIPRRDASPIEVDIPADLPLVRADPAQIERVLANLIDNAAKFSPAGAPIRVSAGAGDGRVAVRVQDQGPGVPAVQRPFVFDPFYRGDGAPRGGSGLGLAICKGFVEANGGRIALRAGPGGGSVFAVSFPLVLQPQAAPAPAEHR